MAGGVNYYPHHIGDYGSATAHLTMLEDAAYRRLIDWYYQAEAPIPADERAIFRRVRASSDDEREAVRAVLGEFFQLDPEAGVYRHRRCDAEIARAQEKSEKARQSVSQRRDRRPGNDSSSARSTNVEEKPTNVAGEGYERSTPNSQEPIANSQGKEREQTRGARLPVDFPDPEAKAWARAEREDLDPDRTAERFRDYWTAQPGAKGRKTDWLATWRNWVRNEKAQPQARASPQQSKQDRNADIIAQLTGRTRKDDPNVIDAPARIVG